MGVYIRGMEMPGSCYKCPLRRRDGMDIVCPVAHERFSVADVNILDYRLSNCPLAPAQPHGRWNHIIQGIIPSGQCSNCGAWEDGVVAGVSNACAIFLTVLLDKFNAGEQIMDVWDEINKLSEAVKERRVSVADLRTVLREEYGIEV